MSALNLEMDLGNYDVPEDSTVVLRYKGFVYEIIKDKKKQLSSVKVFYRLSNRNKYIRCYKRIFEFDQHKTQPKHAAIFIKTPENQKYNYLVNLGKWFIDAMSEHHPDLNYPR